MTTGNYNIKNLMEVLYDAMKGVSKNIFVQTRPKTHEQMKDFIVISFPNRIYDNIGTGNTNCVIELYAKDTAAGINLTKLSSMQESVYERMPVNNDVCTIYRPVPVNTGSDGLGFHSVFIYCKVSIK